jgi:8-oxo-dGTP pyrophosphatase MutT (NUDIX family)
MPEITASLRQSWQRRREDHSAGGVAYRWNADEAGFETALIATRGGTRWQLPKGACEEGETSVETAIREVEEEVGLRTTDDGFLDTIEYWYWDTYQRVAPELVCKRVDFYLLRVIGGALSDVSFEVDSAGWFTPDQAEELLTFEGERAIMRLAKARLEDHLRALSINHPRQVGT